MDFPRAAGILLHPTSLPGFGGIGSIGREAFEFADQLGAAEISLWQVLPLSPTGYGDSPYAALSAFAGNPLLISLENLLQDGLLSQEGLARLDGLPETHVDFGRVVAGKPAVLRTAFDRWRHSPTDESGFKEFVTANAEWLHDFALFMTLKDRHGGAPWWEWEQALRRREPGAIREAESVLTVQIHFHEFLQWQFSRQWTALKSHVNALDIRIIGDIPIFVAHDSADVWSHQELFLLDREGLPIEVAGVPPDYFTATGQLWGNPHYRWEAMEADGFSWWLARFRHLLKIVDIIRLDHFRGFAAAWHVPYGKETAIEGKWVPTPGRKLFAALVKELGDLPIIAEDLGFITPDVVELRKNFGFPGMHILQFAFGSGPENESLPHNLTHDSVVYTGTHDNATTVEWFASIPAQERQLVLDYCGSQGFDISWDLIRQAFASVSVMAIAPLQDVLRLGPVARMNLPGRASGNWSWRFTKGALDEEKLSGLRRLSETYGRTTSKTLSFET